MLRKGLVSMFVTFCLFFISQIGIAGIFECGISPGEGIPSFIAKKDLSIYKNPSKDSMMIKGIKIPAGQKIDFNETKYRTTKSGSAKVLTSISIDARSYGTTEYLSRNDYYTKGTRKSINLKIGDVIEYLQERAEGEGFVRINGEILACDILVFAFQKKVEITSEPVNEWWVRVVDDKKQPIGWVLVNDKTVKFLNRQFRY